MAFTAEQERGSRVRPAKLCAAFNRQDRQPSAPLTYLGRCQLCDSRTLLCWGHVARPSYMPAGPGRRRKEVPWHQEIVRLWW
eukprot:42370-Eustigmatos_ZCMA.PRE.1